MQESVPCPERRRLSLSFKARSEKVTTFPVDWSLAHVSMVTLGGLNMGGLEIVVLLKAGCVGW